MYYCPNQAEKLTSLKRELAFMREAAEAIPDIIAEVKRFDGKQLTIKLSKAIALLEPAIFSNIGKQWSSDSKRRFEIAYSSRDNFINNRITLYWCSDVTAITDNGKLLADKVITALQNKRTELLNEAEETESKLQFISFYQQKVQQIEQDLKYLEQGIPSKIKQYFNLGAEVKYRNF